jgi:TRAP-type C4-dicarboxylate transport system permease small subunit
MRRFLDALYTASGALAGLFLVLIGVLVLFEIVGRELRFAAYSFDEFAGYCMAASSFLALAHTFRHNEHIRVSLLIEKAGPRARKVLEILCLGVAALLVGYFAVFSCHMVYYSWRFHEVSQGLAPIPLWIPQTGMALGLVVMTIALLDDLVALLRGADTAYRRAEKAKTMPVTENL